MELKAILLAFKDVLKRTERLAHHQIQREVLSVRERMSRILILLEQAEGEFIAFHKLFTPEEGKSGAVVSLLAILGIMQRRFIANSSG